ncbi:MAG: hypothetical protein IT584_01340 [Chlamydiae bacterium]|nr:hypothetical protein [Chlamydiota bacterium]
MRARLILFPIAIKIAAVMMLSGCYKNHLYVQQEWVDANFLASHYVGSPDPRALDPPEGQRLLIAWKFPKHLFGEPLTFLVTVRLWDNSEQIFVQPIEKKNGTAAYYFPDKNCDEDHRILTYKIEVFNARGDLVEEWKHHFWRELIELNAEQIKSSVSVHPKQGSVTDTP